MRVSRYLSVILFLAFVLPSVYAASLGLVRDRVEAPNQGVSNDELKSAEDGSRDFAISTASHYLPNDSTHAGENITQRQYPAKLHMGQSNLIGTSGYFVDELKSRQAEISTNVNDTKFNLRTKRLASVPNQMFWPDAEVPFRYDMGRMRRFRDPNSHPEIAKAMKFWSDNTCVKFIPFDDTMHLDFLDVGLGLGCSSVVGYSRRGRQTMSLSERGCVVFGTIAHEIGHTLGLFHEQCRRDRDEYVNILWENVNRRYNFNFDVRPVQFLGQYDLGSIMHYGPTAFSVNQKPTIEAKDHRLQFLIGQRDEPSFYDIKAINTMYACALRNCPNIITCYHDGYQDHSCGCKCPDGLAGESCELVQSVSCGGIIELNWTRTETKISSPSMVPSNNPANCVWLVKSPWFTKMNAKLQIPEQTDTGSDHDFLEVRYQLVGQKGVLSLLDTSLTDTYETLTNLLLLKLHWGGGHMGEASDFEMTVAISTLNICATNPCDNGGACSPDDLHFTCKCAEGYTGETCEKIRGPVLCEFDETDRYRYNEANKICFLTQSDTDDFDWTITDQPTPSSGTGPMGGADSYLFVEATNKRRGHVARLSLNGITGGAKCLSLNLHMYGSHMGTFRIGLLCNNQKLDDQYTITGNQGQGWKSLRINLHCPVTFSIDIQGIVGWGYRSDMAVDQLRITPGLCDSATYILKVANFTGPEGFLCIANLNACGFFETDDNGGRFKWETGNGTTKSRRTGPQQLRGSAIFYVDASEPALLNDTARLASPTFYNQGPYCLSFWYSAYGAGLGTLSVFLEDYESEWDKPLWSTSGKIPTDYGWNNVTLEINVAEKFRIVFQAKRGENYRGDYAIQDISVRPHACNPREKVETFPYFCDFNSHLDICGMLNMPASNDAKQWSLAPPRMKRPDTHRDSGSALDVLIWIFPIGKLSARIATPIFKVTGSACLKFWYIMDGYNSTLNSLTVYVMKIREGSVESGSSWPIWIDYDLTSRWSSMQVDMIHNGKLRLVFEAAVAMWWMSVNIDDLKFTPGMCRSPSDF